MIETYKTHHLSVWPEVLSSLKRVGLNDLEIYLLGRRLVMVVELPDGIDVQRVFATHRASTSRVAEWEALMKSLQEPPPGAAAGEWWAVMQPVFHLHEDAPA